MHIGELHDLERSVSLNESFCALSPNVIVTSTEKVIQLFFILIHCLLFKIVYLEHPRVVTRHTMCRYHRVVIVSSPSFRMASILPSYPRSSTFPACFTWVSTIGSSIHSLRITYSYHPCGKGDRPVFGFVLAAHAWVP